MRWISVLLAIAVSTPVFEGNRMYYRGQMNLYCVQESRD